MGAKERVDCVVVGAGVVGLAVSRLLSRLGRDVLVLESEAQIGTGNSSRNSEVIHAGLYYPSGSLKATLCVEGARRLYSYCAESGVSYHRCGKIVVASSQYQHQHLRALQAAAATAGAGELPWLSAADVAALEPEVRCTAALLSPNTGIVDSHGLMLALQGDAEAHGATVVTLTPVLAASATPDGRVAASARGLELDCALLVNSVGLAAPALAATVPQLPAACVPEQFYAKGNYFRLAGVPPPFRRLVYPLPEAATAGLGVHATLDLAGRVRFGPDVQWVTRADDLHPDNDPRHVAKIYAAVRNYWPALPDGSLEPDYAGIRPKLQGPGDPARDFAVHGPANHGVAGLINLFGIESPGLTASMALARHVCEVAGYSPADVAAADGIG